LISVSMIPPTLPSVISIELQIRFMSRYIGEDDIVRIEDNYGREGTNT
jgi:hypothetical protein